MHRLNHQFLAPLGPRKCFWSFLSKTKPDQAFPSDVHGKIWSYSKDPMNNNKDCRVGQLTRLHPGFLSVRFISLHRGSEGLQDIKAFQKKMILNVLKSKERFLYPSWYGGLRADCPSVRRGVRSDAQLSCTDTRFQKCSQSGKNGSKRPML